MTPVFRTLGERIEGMAKPGAHQLPVIAYPTKGNEEFKDYGGPELARMATLAATLYASSLPERALRRSSDDGPKVIGLLGISNLEYIITFLATQLLGLTPLFFSTRLSDAAYKHLVETTRCEAVLVQSRYQPAMDRAQKATGGSLAVVPMFDGTYLFSPAILNAVRPLDFRFDWERERKTPGGIIHSSGSSGLPKPVPLWWQNIFSPLDNAQFRADMLDCLLTVLTYHGYGIIGLVGALLFGERLAFLNANLPIQGGEQFNDIATH